MPSAMAPSAPPEPEKRRRRARLPLLASAAWVAALLAALPLGSWLLEHESTYGLEHDDSPVAADMPIDADGYARSSLFVPGPGGHRLHAWLYVPKAPLASPPPVVLMAHGLGAIKDAGLHPYGEHFATAGFAVLIFDYRTFGFSEGQPRQWVSWSRHVDDWAAALEFVRSGGLGPDGDSSRVGAWGVSYSGGHVLSLAARVPDGHLSAIVANTPYLGGPKGGVVKHVTERGILKTVRLIGMALLDIVRHALGLPAVYVKTVGSHDELALLGMDDLELTLVRMGPKQRRMGGYQPYVTARMILENLAYNPGTLLHLVSAPTLLRGGARDDTCPLDSIRDAAAVLRAQLGDNRTALIELPYGHVEMTARGSEPEYIRPVIEWFRAHLLPAKEASSQEGL